jgi:cysteinyl-tRNA synthetase
LGLVLYNTLTRKKEPFEPDDPKSVRMYVCGPTVYDFAHVGNARPVVVFDVLFRLLQRIYGKKYVTYVRNITDIDDKIIKAAAENNEPIANLTARTEQAFHEDMDALGALPPTHEPRATQHIPGMIVMIERLIESGHAYEAEGHVLFGVGTKSDYGKLSRRDRDEMIAGARVEVAPYKKDPADFVLWKPSAPDQPGWESPWGRGRPGWHLECSAMSEALLGETFDIHGGGLDLVFPHHENEIAQSECAHGGAPFVRFWLHNGYVTVEGEKMSKSLGNFFTVRQLLEEGHRGEAIRLALLSAHYRQPLDFSRDALKSAKHTLDRFYTALREVREIEPAENPVSEEITSALEDDLNTPLALTALHESATALNKAARASEKARLKGALLAGGAELGLLQADAEDWLKGRIIEEHVALGVTARIGIETEIEHKIAAREAARQAKNFAEADRIRAELEAKGVILEDKPGGKTEWRRAG